MANFIINPIKDKILSKEWIMSYFYLIIGAFILALGYAFFMTPYKITPGGIYGISIVLHHKFGFPVGMAALCFNLPLTLIGLKLLGPRFGVKTFMGFILTALFTDGLIYFLGNDPLNLHDEVLLASIFGGVVMGVGVGLIFKSRASSGGSDVLASILAKYTKIPLGKQLMIVDSCIVLVGFLAFQDWKIPLYSWLTIFIMGKVIDMILQGFSDDKIIFIISEKSEELRKSIIYNLKCGGTIFQAKGMYTKEEKDVLFTVMNRRSIPDLQKYIFQIDPEAFITIADAHEILGKGFKSLQEKIN
ncbi:MAG TPA: YitT family protein [Bacteroidales bacterium]|nr:YitT family protein [Bacteroidales bacterium]HON20696.1 YitT family protein [Bacteroidales bacterium]HOR82109.1 YitT family protein [Bacteroidales bacterium]HPJ90428.1 YitT family protein [Bacteroidales bacterium]HQB19322.1 YitT family protein [Bacteroidales bacterium]